MSARWDDGGYFAAGFIDSWTRRVQIQPLFVAVLSFVDRHDCGGVRLEKSKYGVCGRRDC